MVLFPGPEMDPRVRGDDEVWSREFAECLRLQFRSYQQLTQTADLTVSSAVVADLRPLVPEV
jgi:hypothetical protein